MCHRTEPKLAGMESAVRSLLRAGKMLKSGGARLARALRRNGIKVVFGIPGTHTVPLYKGLQELQPEITTITTRHESGAGYAADGYARATGELAAVSVRETDPEQPPVHL